MATKPRPGPPPLPDFINMGDISDELKEYLFNQHNLVLELMVRVEALESSP